MLAQHAFAWLLTYLLHSTLLLGLAWLASKPLARWSVAAEEAVWKIALVGALLTASLQLAAGWEPAAGRWSLAQASQTPPAAVEAVATPVAHKAAPPSVPFRFSPRAVPAPAPVMVQEAPAPAALSFHPSLSSMILGLWALGAAVLLGAYGRSYLKIQRRLRTRPRVVGGHVLTQLRDLSIEAGLDRPVRLSCSSRVPVPLALGLREPEICLPPRALAGLTDEQQEGMLAHELAHLVRRDPIWLMISHVLAGVLFFQPLNWVARRRLREISEMLSDEWAVGFTGRPLSLAGCLAEVAGWSVGIRPLPLPGMADRPSSLARRIRRLLDETRSPEHPARRVWLGVAMVALLIVVAAAAPAISAARPQKPAAPKPPKTAHAAPRAAEAAEDAAEEADDSWLDARPEHDKSEHAEMAEEDADDSDVNVDTDVDLDDGDLDAMVEGTVSSVDEALAGMDDQLASLEEAGLSPEQQRKLEAEIDRTTRKIQTTLQPRMEQLSREMSEKMAHLHETDAEMQRLQQEMEKLATRMRPSDEELDRIRAKAEKLREEGDGTLTREQRDQLRQEARRLAEAARPSKEQREQMRALREELQKRHQEMSRQFRDEHRAEIEKAQAEMRDEIEREMSAMRQELKRSMEERRQIQRQERREQRLERDRRDRDRDHDRDHKRDKEKEESGKEKPPKMVLMIDMLGNLRLVPETPGC
jgi:beta-lactamase regulating signal transducer with metallopeptidase domain